MLRWCAEGGSPALLWHRLHEHLLDEVIPVPFQRAYRVLRPSHCCRHGRDGQLPRRPPSGPPITSTSSVRGARAAGAVPRSKAGRGPTDSSRPPRKRAELTLDHERAAALQARRPRPIAKQGHDAIAESPPGVGELEQTTVASAIERQDDPNRRLATELAEAQARPPELNTELAEAPHAPARFNS